MFRESLHPEGGGIEGARPVKSFLVERGSLKVFFTSRLCYGDPATGLGAPTILADGGHRATSQRPDRADRLSAIRTGPVGIPLQVDGAMAEMPISRCGLSLLRSFFLMG